MDAGDEGMRESGRCRQLGYHSDESVAGRCPAAVTISSEFWLEDHSQSSAADAVRPARRSPPQPFPARHISAPIAIKMRAAIAVLALLALAGA